MGPIVESKKVVIFVIFQQTRWGQCMVESPEVISFLQERGDGGNGREFGNRHFASFLQKRGHGGIGQKSRIYRRMPMGGVAGWLAGCVSWSGRVLWAFGRNPTGTTLVRRRNPAAGAAAPLYRYGVVCP